MRNAPKTMVNLIDEIETPTAIKAENVMAAVWEIEIETTTVAVETTALLEAAARRPIQALPVVTLAATKVGGEAGVVMMTAVTHAAIETATTIEVDELAHVHAPPLDTTVLVMIAIDETDEIEATATPMTTAAAVVEMMTALRPAMRAPMPRLRRMRGIAVPCLSSSLQLGCGLVSWKNFSKKSDLLMKLRSWKIESVGDPRGKLLWR
jgi:hypothetical protein